MERALKERLVGAVVIVIAGVLVIPALLDGPEESDRPIEQGLSLPSSSQGVRTVTIPVGRQADEPAPVPAPTNADPVAPRPETGTVQRPVTNGGGTTNSPAPTPREAPARTEPAEPPSRQAAAPQPAAGEWAVQVGSFSRSDNAERLKGQLSGDGFEAYTSRVVTDAGTMHRVRVGPVASREDADKLLERLVRAGQKGRVVRVED